MIEAREELGLVYRVRCTVTEEEAERLKQGEPFWITFENGIPLFRLEMVKRKAEA